MTVNSINAFLRIVEKGSIAEAARESFMSPQSFWKYLSNLEDELNMKLFTRSGRTLTLSPAGRVWYEYFKNQKENRDALIGRLRTEAEESAGKGILRLGIAQNVWMCPEITETIQAYNALEGVRAMDIHIATAPVLADMLDLGGIDAAITLNYPATTRPSSETVLRTDEYVILASREHPLVTGGASAGEFAGEEFLIGLDGDGFSPLEARVLFSGFFRRATGLTPRVRVLRNTSSAICETRLGNGLMFINGFDQLAISPYFAKIKVGGESSLVFRRQKETGDTGRILELLRKAYSKGDEA